MEYSLQLSGGGVTLRTWQPDDAEDLFAAARESVAEIALWLPWCHANYTRDEALGWVRWCPAAWSRDEEYNFVIEDGEGAFVGGCALNQLDPMRRRANLGYWVRTSRTCRGFATAATGLLARFGFERLDLQRIEIVAALGNLASQQVALKSGAQREGVARNRLRIHDAPVDAAVFSLIPGDLSSDHGE